MNSDSGMNFEIDAANRIHPSVEYMHRLESAFIDAGLSMPQVFEMIGVHRSTGDKWMRGRGLRYYNQACLEILARAAQLGYLTRRPDPTTHRLDAALFRPPDLSLATAQGFITEVNHTKLPHTELAERLGIAPSTLAAWTTNRKARGYLVANVPYPAFHVVRYMSAQEAMGVLTPSLSSSKRRQRRAQLLVASKGAQADLQAAPSAVEARLHEHTGPMYLRDLVALSGLDVQVLAARMGVSDVSVYGWLRLDKARPRYAYQYLLEAITVEAIAKAQGVSLEAAWQLVHERRQRSMGFVNPPPAPAPAPTAMPGADLI